MTGLYQLAGISKQAHHHQIRRMATRLDQEEKWLRQAQKVRLDHPRMGMRALYDHLCPDGIGRDKFVELLSTNGFKLSRRRSFKRTTYSHPASRYPNLISGIELDRPNQMWVSDITYVPCRGKFYYLALILDVYSRLVVGWSLDKTLSAESNLRALKAAIRKRKDADLSQLIHHSDRGAQYIYTPYLKLLKKNGIRVSMGNKAWENAHAERLNGILKLDYILPYNPKSWEDLQRKTRKAIWQYNNKRKHTGINKTTPVEFEISCSAMRNQQSQKMKINY